jgi:hypothetical protein
VAAVWRLRADSWSLCACDVPKGVRVTKKRGYSDEFPTTREKRVYFMLDKIPPALWIRVKAKAKREGVSLRALILGWCKEWVEK